MPRIEYVLIAEAGNLERQALLLVESIRRLPADAGAASITVVSPRPDRRPARRTVRQLERRGARYLPLAIDSPCQSYAPSFKLAAMAEIEKRQGPPLLVMIDTDTLFLASPVFDVGERAVAVRPVDVKGICTTGPDDPADDYWRRLCGLCGVAYDDIPWVVTTIGELRVKACHNGGLAVTNRRHGLFTTSYEFLRRSVAAGLVPHRESSETPNKFRIGAGQGDSRGRRLWGVTQAVLSLALVHHGLEQELLPPTYNVPAHYLDGVLRRFPEVASESVHVHYHWLCDADRLKVNPMLDGRITIPGAVRRLLDRHLPVDQPPTLGRRLRQLVSATSA